MGHWPPQSNWTNMIHCKTKGVGYRIIELFQMRYKLLNMRGILNLRASIILYCHTLAYSGTFCHTLSHHGTPYHTLAHRGLPWHTLSHRVTLWHTLAHPVTQWHTLSHPLAYPGGRSKGGRLPLFEPRELFKILIITECFFKLTTVSKLGEFALFVLIYYWFSA